MSMEDELLAELEAEEKLKHPTVVSKNFLFELSDEEHDAIMQNGQKGWLSMQSVLSKRGATDLDIYGRRLLFTLPMESEYLLDEITIGLNEQLDEFTGRRLKETELWGAF